MNREITGNSLHANRVLHSSSEKNPAGIRSELSSTIISTHTVEIVHQNLDKSMRYEEIVHRRRRKQNSTGLCLNAMIEDKMGVSYNNSAGP